MEQGRTAVVLGATGLVGTELLAQLYRDPVYDRVLSLARREPDQADPKAEFVPLDFEDRDAYARAMSGDVLFSALGTTRKSAGSTDAQWKVDFDYQFRAAEAAAAAKMNTYVLVSSVGADPNSAFFYPKMKGKLEEAISQLPFERVRILRPSFLDGHRKENRPTERLALGVLRRVPGVLLPQAARPVPVHLVALAARRAAADPTPGVVIWEPADILASDTER